jgi:hypothetical protein
MNAGNRAGLRLATLKSRLRSRKAANRAERHYSALLIQHWTTELARFGENWTHFRDLQIKQLDFGFKLDAWKDKSVAVNNQVKLT